jgi:hypothetical protein
MLTVKISYDMVTGKEQECQDYLINKLAPGLARLGFRISEVWYTIWGNSPRILTGGTVEDIDQARRIFCSDAWEKLATGMSQFTENFDVRVVQTRENGDLS